MALIGLYRYTISSSASFFKTTAILKIFTLIIEPWFQPGTRQAGRVFGAYVEQPDCKVARISLTEIEGDLSILHFHYLIGTSDGITHITERHELGLFSHEAYLAAFVAQGLAVTYDAEDLTARGLYIGQR